MAVLNEQGSIQARCPGCNGALSTFEWFGASKGQYGSIVKKSSIRLREVHLEYRLFRCAGCGQGGLGVIVIHNPSTYSYPQSIQYLSSFFPEIRDRLNLPVTVPEGIKNEFREGETCLDAGAIRAAAGMFRSVLDKTLRANGYKTKRGTSLEQQIDEAAKDGVITEARKKRAHEEIRVLGNDVLHDEWQKIEIKDVELSRHYAQRILEDFYDDRASVLSLIRAAGRIPDEDKTPVVTSSTP
jgi:Domain of unknown function (DUF4145)